jgi:predicted RNA binding protein YcfA (HicA-like mRNA interferase family)
MPKLKILSGSEVIKILNNFGFTVASQRGSHVKLQRIASDKARQTLTIPLHDELDRGTAKAIYRQTLRYIPESDLRNYFYEN